MTSESTRYTSTPLVGPLTLEIAVLAPKRPISQILDGEVVVDHSPLFDFRRRRINDGVGLEPGSQFCIHVGRNQRRHRGEQ